MEEQEITKEKLKNKIGISSATMAKLSKNEDVSMSTIQSLCDFFDCHPGAILSYEKEIDNIDDNLTCYIRIKILLFSDFVKKWK